MPVLVAIAAALSGLACGKDSKNPMAPEQTYAWTAHDNIRPITFRAVWGSSGTDVFVVGDGGCIAHYDGNDWRFMRTPTTQSLYDVWGTSGDNVYAIGGATILHYDGQEWNLVRHSLEGGSFEALWGSSEHDIFAVGTNHVVGTVAHYDGSSWSFMASDALLPLSDVWGRSPDDVISVGMCGVVQYYDGVKWTANPQADCFIHPLTLTGVWVSDEGRVFVAEESGLWYPRTGGTEYAVWGSSATDVFVVGDSIKHYNGSAWLGMEAPGLDFPLYGVWGSSGSDVFAVGAGGTILHYDGRTWSAMEALKADTLYDVWTGSGYAVVVGTNGISLEPYGDEWAPVGVALETLRGVGGRWLTSLSAVGDGGTFVRRTGGKWEPMPRATSATLRAVWNGIAVGDGGTIVTSSGTIMSSGTTADLHGICGAGSKLFAVGTGGVILQYDGTVWSPIESPTSADLLDVWGDDESGIFVVGSSGTTLHYDFADWLVLPSPTNADLHAVWGTSWRDIFAVGSGGTIMHFDGTGWRLMESPTSADLFGVWGSSERDVLAVGAAGTILHYGP